MGALSSCLRSSHASDGEGDLDHNPTERTRLLPSDVFRESIERPPQNQAELEALRGQEVLKGIVQRTADNLIDISSMRMLDRIQPEHAVERASEYRSLLAAIGPQLLRFIPSDNPPASSSAPTPSPPNGELLNGADSDDQSITTADGTTRILDAIKEIKAIPVDGIVVPFMGS
ncbi:hypothetical protein HDU87_000257 [Geranomyces variabilis]|uniref:Late endosomal/lysosomal adaptor and MAPK and MTOR activator 1 n=1 Tax=Geranomyces variabilis TaxID=109894 RepID=A0AAD5TUG3_9FUNG|nr:hypothetical protein HDU87_000257 [Geranomyces variabilis]